MARHIHNTTNTYLSVLTGARGGWGHTDAGSEASSSKSGTSREAREGRQKKDLMAALFKHAGSVALSFIYILPVAIIS
jgi:hypothetical protein